MYVRTCVCHGHMIHHDVVMYARTCLCHEYMIHHYDDDDVLCANHTHTHTHTHI